MKKSLLLLLLLSACAHEPVAPFPEDEPVEATYTSVDWNQSLTSSKWEEVETVSETATAIILSDVGSLTLCKNGVDEGCDRYTQLERTEDRLIAEPLRQPTYKISCFIQSELTCYKVPNTADIEVLSNPQKYMPDKRSEPSVTEYFIYTPVNE